MEPRQCGRRRAGYEADIRVAALEAATVAAAAKVAAVEAMEVAAAAAAAKPRRTLFAPLPFPKPNFHPQSSVLELFPSDQV